MTTQAKDRDRARAYAAQADDLNADVDVSMALDEDAGLEEIAGAAGEPPVSGSKVVVIHLGSQNLRIGLASDALPKTVPMTIARRWKESESEENGGEPSPKRPRLDDGTYPEPDKNMFGQEVFCASSSFLSRVLK